MISRQNLVREVETAVRLGINYAGASVGVPPPAFPPALPAVNTEVKIGAIRSQTPWILLRCPDLYA